MPSTLQAEVTVLPLEVVHSDDIIKRSINTLAQYEVSYEVGPLSTTIAGTTQQVWSALQMMFERAAKDAEVVMVAKITRPKQPDAPAQPV
ncbi:MAG: thiamine-binding protein [Limnochordaceae bacterium]|nr:thiamine-binding protein [Limnochordaceae bacterium]